MDFVALKSLTSTSGSVPIQVRVCRLWDCINPNNKKLISVDLIVADSEGTSMWVYIKNSLVSRFRHQLTVGSIYSFQNFNIVSVNGQYRPVSTPTKLHFSLITNVMRVAGPVPAIPMHIFQFVPHATVVQRAGNPTYLTDVVALLVSVGQVEVVSGSSIKRELEILSPTEGKVKLTLWKDQAQMFVSDHKLDAATDPVMIIATSLKVVQFSGNYSFSATSATQLYIDLQHEDVARVRAELTANAAPVVFLGRSPGTVSTTAEAMSENRLTITEILAAGWTAEKPGYKMTFVGRISEILTRHGWFYFGCTDFKAKAFLEDEFYKCSNSNCKSITDSPMVYYKLNFTVRDSGDTIICTALNKVAERMVDSSAKKLFNRTDPEMDAFPQPILDLCGQEFIFKISLSTHNLELGNDSFTVVDVFTTDHPASKTGNSLGVGRRKIGSPGGPSKGKAKVADGQTELNLTPRKRKNHVSVSSEDDEE